MRILYDGLIYSYQTAGGINRYFAKLIGLLPDHWDADLDRRPTACHQLSGASPPRTAPARTAAVA